MPVRILIVDDHALLRDGLRMILGAHADMEVVGEAADGRDAIKKAEMLRPDVTLMDIAMPELNGIESTRMICRQSSSVKVIILSMYNTQELVFRALMAGARGYLLKESASSEVVKAIRVVMSGNRYFGEGVEKPSLAENVKGHASMKSPLDSLSQREREIFQLVVEGKTSARIADILFLSPKSVETYRSRLMRKLGIDNIPSLVLFAVQHGITPPSK
jgi:DNA-binding NarL/FixJ family response regulator